jgi:hypothetical protein
MGTRGLVWVTVVVLAGSLAGGCALVGFDEDAVEKDDHDDEDGGRARRDAGGREEDAGDTSTARSDAGRMDAGGDVERVDAGFDAGPEDAGFDAAEVFEGDDAGIDCPEQPVCEGGLYKTCASGKLHVTDCIAAASTCQIGSCNPDKGCLVENRQNGLACEDGRFCSIGDTCLDGVCQEGSLRDCGSLSGPCTAGVCDEIVRGCKVTPINQGASCGSGGLTCEDGRCSTGDQCANDGCSLSCFVDDGPCDFTCANLVSCNFTCEVGAQCTFNCADTGDACAVTCKSGSTCNVFCATPTECSNVSCAADATCALDCESGVCPAPLPPG